MNSLKTFQPQRTVYRDFEYDYWAIIGSKNVRSQQIKHKTKTTTMKNSQTRAEFELQIVNTHILAIRYTTHSWRTTIRAMSLCVCVTEHKL